MAYQVSPLLIRKRRSVTTSIKKILRPAMRNALRRLHGATQRFVRDDLPQFANEPRNLIIELPRRIADPECMHIGDDVNIGPGALLVAQTCYPSEEMQNPQAPVPVRHYRPRIVIGNRVTATGNLTLSAVERIVIEDDVMFASNVIVMDSLHGYSHANQPYKYQPMGHIAPVVIGRGSWIAQNVVIMPGVSIGELSIVGANSVVTRSIPARSIAFGNPARVVKRWNAAEERWEDTAASGENSQGGSRKERP